MPTTPKAAHKQTGTEKHSAMKARLAHERSQEGLEKNPLERKQFTSLDPADEIALYYGFTPIETPSLGKPDPAANKFLKDIEGVHKNKSCCDSGDVFGCCIEEECALLLNYQAKEMHTFPQPVMLSYEGTIVGKRAARERNFNIHIMGAPKSVTEATIIKTALVILEEEGYKDLSVEINSLGDRESAAKFLRELTAYYRKHLSSLTAECRQAFKRDPLELLSCVHEKCKELAAEAPKSISFLSEKSRVHFKEVLEYLETMGVPYAIANSLVGKRLAAEVVFVISDASGKTLGTGMRYDMLGKRIGLKRDVPSVGARLVFEAREREKVKKTSVITKKPKFYFIQLGFDAKLKSLRVIEMLRQAKVPLFQSLSKDKLQGQMSIAENLKIPYTIIMGQKEAMENSVIVRNMASRSQETVRIDDLPKYLEKVK